MKTCIIDLVGILALSVLIGIAFLCCGCKQDVYPSNVRPLFPPSITRVEVLAFTSRYCGPCKNSMLALRTWSVPTNKHTIVNVTIIDVNDHPDIAREYMVLATPTFIIKVNSRQVERTNSVFLAIGAANRSIR